MGFLCCFNDLSSSFAPFLFSVDWIDNSKESVMSMVISNYINLVLVWKGRW